MSNDFMDLLSGDNDDNDRPGQEDKGMEDLLGGLLGGGGGGLGSLLGGLMGGGGAPSGSAGGAEDLLGSLLGGGGGAQDSDTGDMAGMLGSLLGGGSGSPAQPAGGSGGLGGLLGGLLGGGGGNAGQMSFGGGGGASLPFAGTLAEKLGISEQMASMLIMGAIGLLTSSMAKNRSGGRSVNFDNLSDPDYIRSSGVSSRLSEQMGISEDEAIHGLQQTMGLMVAGNKPAAQPKQPGAKKSTAKKAKPPNEKAAKKPAKTTQTTPKKKSTKKEPGTDFMDLLDDPNR